MSISLYREYVKNVNILRQEGIQFKCFLRQLFGLYLSFQIKVSIEFPGMHTGIGSSGSCKSYPGVEDGTYSLLHYLLHSYGIVLPLPAMVGFSIVCQFNKIPVIRTHSKRKIAQYSINLALKSNKMIQIIAGIVASALHVVTGPDHLAAVTPLAIENKKRSWGVGLFWGLGHIVGMLLIGMLFLMFKEFIPVDAISHYSEQIVGLILIGIGLWAIYKVFNKRVPKHKHPHYHKEPEPYVHIHSHPHQHDHDHEHPHDPEHSHTHKKVVRQNNIAAIGVGTIHGFAGVSHLILLIPTLALPSMTDSVLYLTGFAIGTLGAMISYAAIIGFIGQRSSAMKSPRTFQIVRLIGAALAIGIGIYWFLSTI